jgi:hypothetical protein
MTVAIVLALTSVCNSVAFCCSRCSCLLLVSIVSNTVVGAACALAGATALVDFSALRHWLEDINCGGQRTPAGYECLVSSTGLAKNLQHAQIPVAIGCFAFAGLQFGRALLYCVVWTRLDNITSMWSAVVRGQLQSTADDCGPERRELPAARASFTASLLADVEPVQESGAELQHRADSMPERARERQQAVFGNEFWWLVVASSIWLVVIWLWVAMFDLYFHGSEHSCTILTPATHRVDKFVAAAPIFLRNALLGMMLLKVGGHITDFESNETPLVQALLIGRGSMVGVAPAAGWDAIVGNRSGNSDRELQSTWEQARAARQLTQRQAVSSAITKALIWHSSQPLIYLYVLNVYSCQVASMGHGQRELAAVVAVREILYLASIVLAAWECPVFLLMDPITAWNETHSRKEKVIRVAMYVLTPHNYVAFCLSNHFRGWRRSFLGLAGIQIMADLASCFALGTLIANGISQETRISEETTAPYALIIGYTITAFGFLFFFGPLSVSSSFSAAMDNENSTWLRASLGVAGSVLFCMLSYIVLLFVLLISQNVLPSGLNPYCRGLFFMSPDPCNTTGHGKCYGAGRCQCEPQYGPNTSFSGQPLCAEWYCDPKNYTTLDQPWRSVNNTNASIDWRSMHFDAMKNGTVSKGVGALCGWSGTGVRGDRWFRFVGSGGDALPVKRVHRGAGCGTSSPAWLSGCNVMKKGSCYGDCEGHTPQGCEVLGRYPTAAEGPVTVSICYPQGSGACGDMVSCKPALAIRCDDFFLWNFGSDHHGTYTDTSTAVATSLISSPEILAYDDDDDRDERHRSPLNGGCDAMAYCTTDSATNSTNRTVPPKPSPSPSPGPKPKTCEAVEAKLCAVAKAKGKTQCTSCIQNHYSDLRIAGCHASDTRAFCGT